VNETTELDKARRYLVPVARLELLDEPDLVHLSLYEWLPMFAAWATGPALCGYSTRQGPLAEGTEVTCVKCLEWKPRYEQMLALEYRPEDNEPEPLPPAYLALRAQLEADLKKVTACAEQPARPGVEEARIAQDGIAAGIRASLAWAIHHFEGPEARAAFLSGLEGER
jgi:hypothetical protein